MNHYHELLSKKVFIGSPEGVLDAVNNHGVNRIYDLRDAGEVYELPNHATRYPFPIIEDNQEQDEAVKKVITAIKHALDEDAVVYFHCSAGRNRTGTVATGLLLELGLASSVQDALNLATEKRPVLAVKEEMIQTLKRLYEE